MYCIRKSSNFCFTQNCSVIPAAIIEKTVFSLLYIRAFFVKDKVPIDVWVYIWTFYLVSLVYSPVFVPVPRCLDDKSFVVQSEVRKVDSSSSILPTQNCFGYSGPFAFLCEL